jgi:hypothetical protein
MKTYKKIMNLLQNKFILFIFFGGLNQVACTAQENSIRDTGIHSAAHRGEQVSLALVGYNYTNRSISSFSVDGLGGGDIGVSGESSGGGGSACCVSYVIGAKSYVVKVRWQTGACIRKIESSINNQTYEKTEYIFKEESVEIEKEIPAKPSYFEVHFYPDGHIVAALTEHESTPRLILKKERADRSGYQTCADGKKNGQ